MKQEPIILVDGSSYLFRAYHALPPLTNSNGMPTGAIYGVINMLKGLLKEYSQVIVVFDSKGKTFRNEIYSDYKGNRPEMPEDLACQIAPLHELIKALGLPLIKEQGIEADDIIGTLALDANRQGKKVIISTGDKDMAQLVSPQTSLVNTMTNTSMDEDGVRAKFGVSPNQIIDYLALMGDSVDNVPGVPKVGPKTAAKWLAEYQSLDNILSHQAEFKGKIGDNLREAAPFLPIAKDLVTIRTDLKLSVSLDELCPSRPNKTKLLEMFQELEFKTWLRELLAQQDAPQEDIKTESSAQNYSTVTDKKTLESWLREIKEVGVTALDTETTSLKYMEASLVGFSMAVAGKACYVPVRHQGVETEFDAAWAIAKLKLLAEDSTIKKIGHHIKYDAHILANEGICLAGPLEDTMLIAYVLDSNGRHDLDTLVTKYLGRSTVKFEDVAGKGAKQLRFDEVEIESAAHYAAEDAEVTLALFERLLPELEKIPTLKQVYDTLEKPLIAVLTSMEAMGVSIDAGELNRQSKVLTSEIERLEQEAFAIAGENFNLGSPKQLGEILFGKLGIPAVKKTPTGKPSTSEEVLEELSHHYPLPALILRHRSLSKLRSTYTDKLPEEVNLQTGRVHTSYHQAVTSTGRLSSSDPNLQNIPIRTTEGRQIRQAFIAKPGYLVAACDYSQIELRIMAHLSSDLNLIRAFKEGKDIHRATASEVFGVAIDKVTDDMRRSAKAVNFGLIYGMSSFGLAKQLGIRRDEADHYINTYFARYPGVKDYMERTRHLAETQSYVETVFGRRLYLPAIKASNRMLRQGAERAAINAPMQGTAADIIKVAMINIFNWIQAEKVPVEMIMQVHDELVFEIKEGFESELLPQLMERMEQAATLDVPLLVEGRAASSWGMAH